MSVDASDILTRLLPKLNAAATSDLDYWDADELYRYQDEASKRITRMGIRSVRADIAAVSTAVTTLPTDHATTVQVFWGGTLLRPSNVAELEALDDTWQATTGTPLRWIEDDDQSTGSIRVYPAPTASATLTIIYFQIPLPAISATNTTSPLNRALDSYLLLRSVEAARSKESKGGMPEVSKAIGPLAAQYEAAAISFWK